MNTREPLEIMWKVESVRGSELQALNTAVISNRVYIQTCS